MGLNEIRALKHRQTGLIPDEGSHVPVVHSGPKDRKPLRRTPSEKNKDKKALDVWFEAVAATVKGEAVCWECNSRIPDALLRAATAHIFPKKDFISVATHPSNYLLLGAGCCHDRSHTVARFCKMKIFSEAVDRFLEFEHRLTAKEKALKYYTLFLEAAFAAFPDRVSYLISSQIKPHA
jgi:hypothetical protein